MLYATNTAPAYTNQWGDVLQSRGVPSQQEFLISSNSVQINFKKLHKIVYYENTMYTSALSQALKATAGLTWR